MRMEKDGKSDIKNAARQPHLFYKGESCMKKFVLFRCLASSDIYKIALPCVRNISIVCKKCEFYFFFADENAAHGSRTLYNSCERYDTMKISPAGAELF